MQELKWHLSSMSKWLQMWHQSSEQNININPSLYWNVNDYMCWKK